ncbi:6-phosphofructokinase, alpha subunit [Mycoemilia scoparia]|uniref:ATP-dependent 6-phosphofructokinase n=1 Tax=Mycoemilia scoparia TaxID=417184 RepID=A0A9W8DQJ6_9FUNG|nr:6-phosphofructokinase, alpha subunit [Mycoemilia scoparia]
MSAAPKPTALGSSLSSSDEYLSHITLASKTEESYSGLVNFYQGLKFSLIKEVNYDTPKPDHGRTASIKREAWLCLVSKNSDGSTTLRVLLLDNQSPDDAASSKVCHSNPELSFVYKDLDIIKTHLNENNIGFKSHINPADNSTRLSLRDPVGTRVYVSSSSQSFTVPSSPKLPPGSSLESEIDKIASQSGKDTPANSGKIKKRIGVLTSGGDAQGMNAAVRAVVRMALARNCQAYLIHEGYQGLVDGGDKIKNASWNDVKGFLTLGGTLIGTARCAEFREPKGRRIAAKHLVKNGIDALVVIGGDGSLTGADTLRKEWPDHIKQLLADGDITQGEASKYQTLMIVGIVGSIDNDLASTDMTIGSSSALARICESVDAIQSTATSHKRAFVVEVMGRHCGWLALNAAICTGADYVFIPESPPEEEDWETTMCDSLKRSRSAGKRTSLIIVAEGAIDAKTNPIRTEYIKEILATRLGYDTRVTILGHVQRGGAPTSMDRYLGTLQGAEAVEAILRATPDTPSPVIGMLEHKITTQPLKEAIELTKEVAKAIEDHNFSRAAQLRPKSFLTQLDAYREIAYYSPEGVNALPHDKRLRIGIVHVGAPAGGMNTATRSVVRLCVNRGHTALGIHNGFPGLMRGEIEVLDWLSVDTWTVMGGSMLGTNRDQPDPQLGAMAYQLQKYEIDALVIIGGFEGYTGLLSLTRHRKEYPAFNIPMVLIPATISNNVPGTDFSLGSETAINVICNSCDAIKQSASSSRKRVFIIEVHGGYSGYLAMLGGLSGGATTVYTPEDGITLDRLYRDVTHMRQHYEKESGHSQGRVVLINEKASKLYTTEMVAKIYDAESRGFYGCHSSILGHLQQGGVPSPSDRVRANTLAVSTIDWIQERCWEGMEIPNEDNVRLPQTQLKRKYRQRVYTPATETSAVIGFIGSKIKFTPTEELVNDTDFEKRKPKSQWWYPIRNLIDVVSGLGYNYYTGEASVNYQSCAIDLTADDLLRLFRQ